MKITYLYNSGFTVDFGDLLLVFDCVSIDENRCISQGFLNRNYVERFSSVYFFVSHKHADHYSKRIYDFCSKKVKYILASGTPSVPSTAESIVLRRSEEFCDDTLQVKAYGSTDLGVSFLIRARGVTLFFAGDLNCWHWTSQCPYDEERAARQAFTDELFFHKRGYRRGIFDRCRLFPGRSQDERRLRRRRIGILRDVSADALRSHALSRRGRNSRALCPKGRYRGLYYKKARRCERI